MTVVKIQDSVTAQDIEEDRIGKQIVDAAFHVHSTFGPGLLESVYEVCLVEEMKTRGFKIESQKIIPVIYHGKKLNAGFRLDILANDLVIVEIKAVETLLPVHTAQVLTYLKLSEKRLGYLINFNASLLKEGIKRIVRRK